jgi:hypothetical protein
MEIASLSVSIAQAGAVLAACWAIISGIGAWKREFIGKRQIELAEQVLARFFEIKDAIASIRSPLSYRGEGGSRTRVETESTGEAEILDRAYIAFERYDKFKTVFNEFNTLKYRFMASFGPDSEAVFFQTQTTVNLILSSAQMLGTHYWQRQGRVKMSSEEFDAHLKEMKQHQENFWDVGNENDDIRRRLGVVQSRLDAIVAPCFKEPMVTYSILTTNFWKKIWGTK